MTQNRSFRKIVLFINRLDCNHHVIFVIARTLRNRTSEWQRDWWIKNWEISLNSPVMENFYIFSYKWCNFKRITDWLNDCHKSSTGHRGLKLHTVMPPAVKKYDLIRTRRLALTFDPIQILPVITPLDWIELVVSHKSSDLPTSSFVGYAR